MRVLPLLLACACAALSCSRPAAANSGNAPPCPARLSSVEGRAVAWHQGSPRDAEQLERWCRAVGPPILRTRPDAALPSSPPAIEDLVVVTWNAHLAEGRLPDLVRALRAGELTAGRAVNHFVILIQEAYRRGADVPEFPDNARSAFGIVPREPDGADALRTAEALGLAMWYVPSMRNGREMREDRGSAIVATEPLFDLRALELPLARQRRVAVGAAIEVRTRRGTERLVLLSTHLEPVSSPQSLWILRNPRPEQVGSLLELLAMPAFAAASAGAGVVVGGDFNTIRGGDGESAYALVRNWSTSLRSEDRRRTHLMGRLDYLFFRLADGWTAQTQRLDQRFGSDHYPVIGRFVAAQ